MTCGAVHPEHPEVTCARTDPLHTGDHFGAGYRWASGRLARPRRPRESRAPNPGPAIAEFLRRTGGTRSQAEGMAVSFTNIRQDPHNWPIVQQAVREACRTHEEVSSNEVWDVLIGREDFTYSGDKGFMGNVLYQWARKQGLVGNKVGKVENRQPWSHSTEQVNLYPSRTYEG